EIFYVGKGKGHRKTSKNAGNKRWLDYVSKLDGNFKVLVVKKNLDEIDALTLEKKIIQKVDWHYEDASTNVTDASPHFDDEHVTRIVFNKNYVENKSENTIPNIRFKNLTDDEIICSLLNFPNEDLIQNIWKDFELVTNYFHDNYDELEEIYGDIFYVIEGVINTIEDLLSEYKCSEKDNLSEFFIDLKREKVEIEIIKK